MSSGDDFTTIWLPNSHMRERAQVPATSRASLDAVRGFLTPRYVEHMDDGRRVAELHQTDLDRVRDGYACGECLAYFDQRFAACPACSHVLEPNRDIVDWHPPHWQPDSGRTSDEILESLGPAA